MRLLPWLLLKRCLRIQSQVGRQIPLAAVPLDLQVSESLWGELILFRRQEARAYLLGASRDEDGD